MKCPVCDQENNTLRCSRCGFDASLDYSRFPTFGQVCKVPSFFAQYREWHMQDQEKLEQISALLAALLAVRYLKLISEDPYVRSANHRLHILSAELEREKATFDQASAKQTELEEELRSLVRSKNALENKNKTLEKDIQNWKEWNKNSSRYNASLVLSIRKLETRISELESSLKNAIARSNELESALEAERSKGLISRVFKR